MRIKDLGALDGEVLLYGGPYSNLQASRALFDWADAAGIAVKQRICTGDVVAYCADAPATVQEVRNRGGHVIAGNCEQQLAQGADDCGCGFDEGTTCSLLAVTWYRHAKNTVPQGARQWMGTLPDFAVFTHKDKRYVVLHGGATHVSRYIWPTSPDAVFEEEITLIRSHIGTIDGIIAGHCGLPFQRRIGKVQWINAGVIGLAPNDGNPDTGFATLADNQVSFHKLGYDTDAAYAAMQTAGLTGGYQDSLISGWWPSEDVLPPELRRETIQA